MSTPISQQYAHVDFSPLDALAADEVVTHSIVRDVALPSGRTLALVTLDNGRDHRRPNTLGPATLTELKGVLDDLARRGAAGEIDAVGVTGKRYILAAGADLSDIARLGSRANATLIAQRGHQVLGMLGELGVPTFAFVNGLALGGGVEIALHCTYRTVDASAAAIALPEVFLGIFPGWGGTYLLPNLVGIENALQVIISNPLRQNRTLKAQQAFELGMMDAVFPAVNFLEDSLRWADGVLGGAIRVERPHVPGRIERTMKWPAAIKMARGMLRARIGDVPRAPYVALDLLDRARTGTPAEAFAREDEQLAALVTGDQFAASMYAFDLVQHRAKRPAGVPDPALARRVDKVGVIGAGLMACQFALLFLRRLRVPVVITDIDQVRVDRGLAHIHADIDALHEKGRVDADEAARLHALVHGTTDRGDYADCDFVIEAVFEDLAVKQQVFADIEPVLADDAVLATNTSSLSVAGIGARLAHPERLIGFHFFNPVAVMPLVEVAHTQTSTPVAVATGVAVAKDLRKNAVLTADAPGFVVNRLLAGVFGQAARAVDEGAPLMVVEQAFAPLGLPMTPFRLIDMVGWQVAAHVQDTMAAAFPDRFYASQTMRDLAGLDAVVEKDKTGRVTGWTKAAQKIVSGAAGSTAPTPEEILRRVQDALAGEMRLMLDDDVVSAVEDIDLCLILGAGWPFIDGGASVYLDREGASERATGGTFHRPPIRGITG